MIGIYILFTGVALFTIAILVYDWLARRQQRREHERQRRSA